MENRLEEDEVGQRHYCKLVRKVTAAGIFSLTIFGCGDTTIVESEQFHEAVVIGSGYGGSVSALRLGEAGIQTVVLEKGRRWDITDPTRSPGTFATLESVSQTPLVAESRASWLTRRCFGNLFFFEYPLPFRCKKSTGALELASAQPNPYDFSPKMSVNNIQVWSGAGVGGGSLINNGITYRPLREAWLLSYDLQAMPFMEDLWHDLDNSYFEKAEAILNPSPIPDDIMATPYYENNRLHMEHMVAGGYPLTNGDDGNELHGTSKLDMIMDWDIVREELAGTRAPSAIKGEAWWGINSGAKFSLDRENNYLGLAEATGSVEIKPLHTVTDISFDETTDLYTVMVMRTNVDYDPQERITITTPNLIVSAGSLGTTKLMMKAKHTGQLPRLNDHVGTLWSNNGNTATLRVVKDSRVNQGGPAGWKSTDFDDPNALMTIENLSQRVPFFVNINPAIGGLFSDVEPDFNKYIGSVLTIAVGNPSKTGNFGWDDSSGTVTLDWPADASKNIYDRFFGIMQDLDVFGEHRVMPIELAQRVTLHPLGGMPIGMATDEYCQVKNYESLYAVDGSVIPAVSALANPTLLISSIAERCLDRIVDDIIGKRSQ